MGTYDREALALAYVESLSEAVVGMHSDREGYPDAVLAHRKTLINGLQRLFDIDFDATGPLLALLRDTARSYLAITSPGGGLTEQLIIRLTEFGIAGDVLGDLEQIQATNADSRAIHLRVLTTLITALLGDKADRIVTDDDLRAIGVDPTPPNPNDYEF
ncbi:MAG TPA: hypothetical protein VGN81_39715 [Pseudonocardiaceae bacterium]